MPFISPARVKGSSCSSCFNSIEHDVQTYDEAERSSLFLSTPMSAKGLRFLTNGFDDPCLKLSRCYLYDNNISSSGALLLAHSIIKSHNLRLVELSIENNGVGDLGAEYLSCALRKNKVLKMLNLENNGIGWRGATCLARSLSCENEASALRWLVLSGNNLGDDGARAMLNCVGNTHSLESLFDGSNHILHSIVLKKVNVKDRSILKDMSFFLKINRMYNLSTGAAKRKINLCVHEDPNLLLDYVVKHQQQEESSRLMFLLQPEIYSFFAERLAILFHVIKQCHH